MANTINLNSVMKFSDLAGGDQLTWALSVRRQEIVACMTPEGPSDDFVCTVWLDNFFTGSRYVLKTAIFGKIVSQDYDDGEGYCETVTYYKNAHTVASDLIEKMKAKGVINLDNWKAMQQED